MSDEQVEEIIVDSTTEEDGEPEASSGAMVRLLDEPPTLLPALVQGSWSRFWTDCSHHSGSWGEARYHPSSEGHRRLLRDA